MKQPDKCPKCGAEQEIPFNVYGYKCGTSCDGQVQSDLCKEWVLRIAVEVELAATKRALEEMRVKVKKFEPYYLDYISSVSAAGLPADGPCLACNGFGGHEEGCHGTTGLMAMAYELETLRSRVRELEGLAIGNQESGDGGLWVEVFIPIERLGGANCEGEECPTLGDAMPRKEEA